MTREQTFIRVLGERNTGTRALIQMMRAQPSVRLFPRGERGPADPPELANLAAQVDRIKGPWQAIYMDALRDRAFAMACPTKLWKHARLEPDPAFAAKSAHLVFCVRDPYSWVISLARNPYHFRGTMPKTLAAFIAHPWMTLGRDNMAAVLASPLELWNGKNRAYRDFPRDIVPVETLKFEDFIAAPEVAAARILEAFNVPHGPVERLKDSTKDSRSLADIADYHAREGWVDWLTSGAVDAINAAIDWDVAAAFGYARRDPAEYPDCLPPATLAAMRAQIGRMGKIR